MDQPSDGPRIRTHRHEPTPTGITPANPRRGLSEVDQDVTEARGASPGVSTTAGANRRLDIQGLRAIAVLTVVGFHAGLPIPGGFVGVDVFFVISGFVITSMLRREWAATGRIRFVRFYLRRFRRLTPALAVMVAVTLAIAALIFSPLGPQQNTADTALGTMLLVANWVIASNTGDYFDAPAEANPLLNTWSLSVEEQFYLVFPAILLVGWLLARRAERGSRAPIVIVSAVTAASFASACLNAAGVLGSETTFLVGFYGPLSRAWEFGVGAILALLPNTARIGSARLTATVALGGAATLLASLWIISSETRFPGPWTLLPVLGTLVLIAAGSRSRGVITRLLAARPMVKIGDWSYSLYLWHWPLIVFATLLWPETAWAPAAAAAVSFAPAIASYNWVEEPMRRVRERTRRGNLALVGAVALPPIALAVTVSLIATHFWTPRFAAGEVPVAYSGDVGHLEFHRFVDDHFVICTPLELRQQALNWEGIPRCHQSKGGRDVDTALLGDSHAEHLFLGLSEELPERNLAYYVIEGLPERANAQFALILDRVLSSSTITTVIITAYWGRRGVPEADLQETLRTLRDAGKTVFLTDDLPDFRFEPFGCKYRSALLAPTKCSQDSQDFRRRYDVYVAQLERLVATAPEVELLRTSRYFCRGGTCSMTLGDKVMFRDKTHLNIEGSRFVARRMLGDNLSFRNAVRAGSSVKTAGSGAPRERGKVSRAAGDTSTRVIATGAPGLRRPSS
jgi:peptidoglycan/LPS O-acetylase OafA/YrhL